MFLITGLFHVLSPWVAAFVRHERLSRYIKIRTDYPGCIPGKQAPELFKCQCEFILEGVRAPSELTFGGPSLHESYDPKNRTYRVSGPGTIRAGLNRIDISTDRIAINGTELPTWSGYSSFYVVVGSDGKLTNTRIDISW
jgi:hypothetical protein